MRFEPLSTLALALFFVKSCAVSPFSLLTLAVTFESCEVDTWRCGCCEPVRQMVCEQLAAVSALMSQLPRPLQRFAIGGVCRPDDVPPSVLALGHSFASARMRALRFDRGIVDLPGYASRYAWRSSSVNIQMRPQSLPLMCPATRRLRSLLTLMPSASAACC